MSGDAKGRRNVARRREMALRGKRVVDVVGAGSLLVISSPLIGCIALAIRVSDGKPVFFRQERPGLNGQPFTMVKFRTMRATRQEEDMLTTDAARVTRLGVLLRRTSLDELPELWNVLKGEMSLVGPRPLLIEYLPKYSPEHMRRHDMRPGVTGLAQVSGRRRLTMGQRLDLDVEYIDSWSPRLDVVVLLKTLLEPLKKGADESQTLEEVDDVGFFTAA